MKKTLIRLIACVISTVVTCSIMLACSAPTGGQNNDGGGNNTQPTATTYTVTVLYPDTTPVVGNTDGTGGANGTTISVQFFAASSDDACATVEVGANGKASITSDKLIEGVTEYKIKVVDCPLGYTFPDYVSFQEGKTSMAVALTQSDVTDSDVIPEGKYKVTVLYPDGTPVNGIMDGTAGLTGSYVLIQVCSDGSMMCGSPVQLNVNGYVILGEDDFPAEDNLTIKILGLPSGYTYVAPRIEDSNIITITLVQQAQ